MITIKSLPKALAAALFGVAALGLGGCNSMLAKADTPPVVSCAMPLGPHVVKAFEQARSRLVGGRCNSRFEAYDGRLREIAKGDRGEANRQRFHGFYQWAVQRGIISKVQARERYTRYYSGSYAAVLPDGHSTCALAGRKKTVVDALGDEAEAKREGLLDVLDNRDEWFEAKRKHDELVFLIETVSLACEQET